MSRQLLVLNLILAAVAVLFGVKFARDLAAPRPLPQRPPARALALSPPAADPAPRPDQRALYNVIAARSLFNPSRTESAAAPAPSQAAALPKPFLHGVVLDATKSRAYLEDPASKKVFAYAVGDAVAGGKLEAIKVDRVVIARPDGPIEVLLRDPSKPQPPPPAAPGARPAGTVLPTPAAAAPTVPGAPSVQVPNPSNPFLRSIQPHPTPAPPVAESPAPAIPGGVPSPPRSLRHARPFIGN